MVGFARCRRVVDRVEQILDDEAYHDHSKMVIKMPISAVHGRRIRTMDISTKTVSVNGFQVEFDTTQNNSGLYETGGRTWVNKPGKKIINKRNYIKGKWAKLKLRAVGRNITVQINDTICSELKNDKGPIKSCLGLQLHEGQKMKVEYKDIQIKEL